MKSEFILTLFDDEQVRNKLSMLSRLEAMFDDDRNQVDENLIYFEDELPFGSKVKVTIETVDVVDEKQTKFEW